MLLIAGFEFMLDGAEIFKHLFKANIVFLEIKKNRIENFSNVNIS